MWSIYEVAEGDCKGKYVILSFMGHPVLRDDEPAFFDTVEEASEYLDEIASSLVTTINNLGA